MISVISAVVLLDEELLQRTKSFFEDIRAGMTEEDELIVIDNGSRIGREEMMKTADIYIHTPEPVGCATAWNLGAKIAKGNYIVIASNDCRVGKDWVDKTIEKFSENEKIGIVSCNGSHMIPSTGTAFNGVFWTVRRKVFEDVGYFEKLQPKQADDSDFCIKVVAADWEIDVADFYYDHPTRKSTHIQNDFNELIRNSSLWKEKTLCEKRGLEKEQDWYKKALEMRKI